MSAGRGPTRTTLAGDAALDGAPRPHAADAGAGSWQYVTTGARSLSTTSRTRGLPESVLRSLRHGDVAVHALRVRLDRLSVGRAGVPVHVSDQHALAVGVHLPLPLFDPRERRRRPPQWFRLAARIRAEVAREAERQLAALRGCGSTPRLELVGRLGVAERERVRQGAVAEVRRADGDADGRDGARA